jgi:hypothetical protein
MGSAPLNASLYAVAYTMGGGDDVPSDLRGKTIISYFSPVLLAA